MSKKIKLSLAGLTALLFTCFVILPLICASTAQARFEQVKKQISAYMASKNHHGKTSSAASQYTLKITSKGLYHSTALLTYKGKAPLKLDIYNGPIIFHNGVHFAVARLETTIPANWIKSKTFKQQASNPFTPHRTSNLLSMDIKTDPAATTITVQNTFDNHFIIESRTHNLTAHTHNTSTSKFKGMSTTLTQDGTVSAEADTVARMTLSLKPTQSLEQAIDNSVIHLETGKVSGKIVSIAQVQSNQLNAAHKPFKTEANVSIKNIITDIYNQNDDASVTVTGAQVDQQGGIPFPQEHANMDIKAEGKFNFDIQHLHVHADNLLTDLITHNYDAILPMKKLVNNSITNRTRVSMNDITLNETIQFKNKANKITLASAKLSAGGHVNFSWPEAKSGESLEHIVAHTQVDTNINLPSFSVKSLGHELFTLKNFNLNYSNTHENSTLKINIDQATGNKFFSLKNFNLDSSKALLKVNAERLSLARPGFLSPRSPGVMKIMFSNLNFEHNNLSKDNSVGFSNVNYQVDTHSSHSDHYIADVNFGLAINHIKTPEKLLSMIKDYLLHHSKGTYTRSEILNQITNHMISKQSQIRLSNMKVRYHYDNGHISLYQNPDAIDLTLNGNLLIDWPNLSKGYRFPDLVAATQTHMNLNAPMIQLKHRGKQFTAKNITIGNNDGMSQGSKYESHFSAGPLEFTPNHAIHSSLASGIKIKNISASGTGTVAVKAQHKTEDALLRFAISGLCIKDKDCFDGTLSMNFNNLQLNDDATENQIKGLAGILIYRNNPQQLAKFIHSLAKNNDSFLAKDTNLHINFSLSNKAGKAIHDTVTLSYPNGSLEQPQAHGTMDINNRIFSAFPQISLSLKKVLANLSTHHCVTTQDQENYHTVISPNESDNTIRLNDQPLVTCFKPNSHAPEFAKASTPRVSPQLGRPSHPL